MSRDEFVVVTVDELFTRALAIDDEEDHGYWELVQELQRRGDQSIFEAASAFCSQAFEPERRLGLNVLAQLGYPVGRPFLEESLPIVLALTGGNESVGVLVDAGSALGHLNVPRVYPVCCDTWGTPMTESASPWPSRFRALPAIHPT